MLEMDENLTPGNGTRLEATQPHVPPILVPRTAHPPPIDLVRMSCSHLGVNPVCLEGPDTTIFLALFATHVHVDMFPGVGPSQISVLFENQFKNVRTPNVNVLITETASTVRTRGRSLSCMPGRGSWSVHGNAAAL